MTYNVTKEQWKRGVTAQYDRAWANGPPRHSRRTRLRWWWYSKRVWLAEWIEP